MNSLRSFWRRGELGTILAFLWVGTVSAQSGQDFHLSYQWTVGEKFSYAVYIVGKVEASGEATQEIKIEQRSVWEVVEGDPGRDLYTVTEKAQSWRGSEIDLRSFGLLPAEETIVRQVDSYGRSISVARYPEGSRFYLLPVVFPTASLSPGQKWKMTFSLLVPVGAREVRVPVVVEYSVVKVFTHYKTRTHPCVQIRLQARYESASEAAPEGVRGEFEGKVLFDPEEKKVIDYQVRDYRREWIRGRDWVRTTTLEVTALEQK